jgi:class 3 adenylate cyclase
LVLADEFAPRGSESIGEGASLRPKISIGLHYGPVVTGEIGGERQQQFTVSGDTVNVASGLEALTRVHGATIIASDTLIRSAQSGTPGVDALLAGFVPLASQPIQGPNRTCRPLAVAGTGCVRVGGPPEPDRCFLRHDAC